jgi:hypothetical protein
LNSDGSVEDLAYVIAGRKRPLEQNDPQSVQSPMRKQGKKKWSFSFYYSVFDFIHTAVGRKAQAKTTEESESDTVNDKFSSLTLPMLKKLCKEQSLSSSNLLHVFFLMYERWH